jgi:hypothetical protein
MPEHSPVAGGLANVSTRVRLADDQPTISPFTPPVRWTRVGLGAGRYLSILKSNHSPSPPFQSGFERSR